MLASMLEASVGVMGLGEVTMVVRGMPPLVVGEGKGWFGRRLMGDGVMLWLSEGEWHW